MFFSVQGGGRGVCMREREWSTHKLPHALRIALHSESRARALAQLDDGEARLAVFHGRCVVHVRRHGELYRSSHGDTERGTGVGPRVMPASHQCRNKQDGEARMTCACFCVSWVAEYKHAGRGWRRHTPAMSACPSRPSRLTVDGTIGERFGGPLHVLVE